MTDLEYRVLKYNDDHPKTNGHPEFEIVKGVGMDPLQKLHRILHEALQQKVVV